jgi:hypothetical protein
MARVSAVCYESHMKGSTVFDSAPAQLGSALTAYRACGSRERRSRKLQATPRVPATTG